MGTMRKHDAHRVFNGSNSNSDTKHVIIHIRLCAPAFLSDSKTRLLSVNGLLFEPSQGEFETSKHWPYNLKFEVS
jgi:hypothetical protein